MTWRRAVRDHRCVKLERSISRLPITGCNQIEQKPSDDRQPESRPGSPFIVHAYVGSCCHGGERLLDERRDQPIERWLALRATSIALEEEPFDRPQRRNRGPPPAHANRLRRIVRQLAEPFVLIAFDRFDHRGQQTLA